ncbi:CTL-like protein 2 isoform X2 [Cephus cinctus]|uniref:Choline transporter-like protein n=1 Tax=Cephus cinctus TaxID=211228 RepID=A0AAJ7W5Z8_CEPCN|nr:CTL-like protein 2 isoform X2 [Cephus cinctus]
MEDEKHAFMAGWAAVGYYALSHGDTNRLLVPTDSEGRKCGVDSEVLDRPYLIFFDLTTCLTASAPYSGCDTPQVCLKECPKSNYIFSLNSTLPIEELRNVTICKIDVDLSSKNLTEIENYILKNKCASWYLRSTSITGRCIPVTIWDEFVNMTIDNEKLSQAKGVVEVLATAQTILLNAYDDLLFTWKTTLVIIAISGALSLSYIVLLRWLATPFAFLTILGVLGLFGYTTYASYTYYSENGGLGWIIFSILCGVILVIILVVVIFLRSRIYLACQLIKEASKAMTSILSSLIFPIIPWILHLLVLAYTVAGGFYLASIGIRNYAVQFENDDSCVCPDNLGYTNNSVCVPDVFTANCYDSATNSPCTSSGCHLISTDNPWYINYLHAINVVAGFWLFFFVSALGEMILAGTFATWYWTYRKEDVPFFTMSISIWRTIRYHLGTLAFGSLIITICRLIRLLLESIDAKLKEYNNKLARGCLKCCKCCFWLLESFLKFINRNAYIMCAIHGKNFFPSARDAFNLLMRNIIRVAVLDKITDWILLLGKILITGLFIWITWWYYQDSKEINYWAVPILLVGVGSFLISTVFFTVHSAAVDTIFLCFLEDCERNDGSSSRPYYMSKRLMKLLRR